MSIYPEILKAVRETINMNQEEFAKILGISRSTLYKWEEGISTPAKQASKIILNYLNIQAGKNSNDYSLLAKIVTAATMIGYEEAICKNIARAENQLWSDYEQQRHAHNVEREYENHYQRPLGESENNLHLKDENELYGEYVENSHQFIPSDYSDELNESEDSDADDNDVSKNESSEILLKKSQMKREAHSKITEGDLSNDQIMNFLGRLNKEQLIFVKKLVDFKLK